MSSVIKQTRVILWCVPRSASTAFEFSMERAENCCILHAPYVYAKYFGIDRTKRIPPVPEALLMDGYSYRKVFKMLENPYPGYDVVFCKDMAVGVYRNFDFLPLDYVHTFLIRDPRKSIPSLNKILLDMKFYEVSENLDFELCGFEACELLLDHVTSKLGQPPIIIDSDDLLNNPEGILREYCQMTGILFTPKMLHFKPEMQNWPKKSKTMLTGLYKRAIDSRSFETSRPVEDLENEPKTIQENIRLSRPYYERLYDQRIVASSPIDTITEC